jgi:hypothetical protein
MIITLIGCGSRQVKNESDSSAKKQVEQLQIAVNIANELINKGLPIGGFDQYTATNDPDKLLGLPGQYISKIKFCDVTIESVDKYGTVPGTVRTITLGGSIEVFSNSNDANNRKSHIDTIGKQNPALVEYSYINGNALLRLDKDITPDQATKYEKIFKELKI